MGRKNRNYKRGSAHKDACKFMIICEGSVREVEYFEQFLIKASQRIILIVESPEGHRSSPAWVQDCAAYHEEKEKLDWNRGDELWLVMDVDRWEQEQLIAIGKLCQEYSGNWECAISNPCFEIWLLLRYTDTIPTLEKSKQVKQHLDEVTGDGYRIRTALPMLTTAIQRAKTLDQDPTHFYPAPNTSKVYQLIEALQQKL